MQNIIICLSTCTVERQSAMQRDRGSRTATSVHYWVPEEPESSRMAGVAKLAAPCLVLNRALTFSEKWAGPPMSDHSAGVVITRSSIVQASTCINPAPCGFKSCLYPFSDWSTSLVSLLTSITQDFQGCDSSSKTLRHPYSSQTFCSI